VYIYTTHQHGRNARAAVAYGPWFACQGVYTHTHTYIHTHSVCIYIPHTHTVEIKERLSSKGHHLLAKVYIYIYSYTCLHTSCVCVHVWYVYTYTPDVPHTHTHTHTHEMQEQSSAMCQELLVQAYTYPPKKLLGSGFSTPYIPFCLICTISSELTCISHLYPFEWAGVDIRWFSVDGFDTRWIPRSFVCGYTDIHAHTHAHA